MAEVGCAGEFLSRDPNCLRRRNDRHRLPLRKKPWFRAKSSLREETIGILTACVPCGLDDGRRPTGMVSRRVSVS